MMSAVAGIVDVDSTAGWLCCAVKQIGMMIFPGGKND